jgi:prevent-host-death family protein
MAIRILPASEVRDKMASVLKEIDETGEPIFITQYSRAKAVLMGIGRYNIIMDLLEDLEDSADSELARRLTEARASYSATGGIDYDKYRTQRVLRSKK